MHAYAQLHTYYRGRYNDMCYQVPIESVSGLAELFSLLEEVKAELGIESYTVGQTTLEQVFLSKAAEHSPED